MRYRFALRLLLAGLLVALTLALAACGGGGGGGGGAAVPEGAQLVPADTPLFIAANTDFESAQWKALEELFNRFPSGNGAIQSILKQFAGEGVDVETELKPAFGPETDLAILELSSEKLASVENAPVVLLTKPSDPAKLEALLAKGKDKAVWKVTGDGWYVVADNEQIIDRVLSGSDAGSLADSDAFRGAMEGVSEDAVAKLYLNGAPLIEAFKQGLQQSAQGLDLGSLGAGTLQSAALAVTAEPQGVRLEGVSKTEGAPELPTYAATLPSVVPSGALLFASFSNLKTSLQQFLDLVAKQTPDFEKQLGQVELGLGVSVDNDVLPLFEGEHALYVRPGVPIPEVTLLLSPADPQRGLATLDKLTNGIGVLAGLSGGESPLTVTDTSIAGVPAKQLTFSGQKFSLYYAQVGQNLVLTTALQGIADLAAPAGHLADDPLFQEASDAAPLPNESLGFLYVDLRDGLSLLEQLDAFKNANQGTVENLRPLQYLVAYATGEKDEISFSGFLGVK